MRYPTGTRLAAALILGATLALAACGKKDQSADTNIVAMNAMDGSMNDMTTVDAATLDAAGSTNLDANATTADNASNAM
ncbi:hypothetical protein [Sphingomonas crocodyli]|jgi:hypothetical protein|uniref:Circumsporozoite protein n=1 Tax=Sphingomonas crocodyli TaxID=1979270 RepID=A0A437LWB3_9SPHN|nr:hypothetical protein [Sphingomonas crocodyli]RVT89682.1 hypothetical protein EOD43_20070 [Sphingomonas crocodyli]